MVKQPNFAHYPKMAFPKEVAKQIKKVESVTKAWAVEDADYAEREQALAEAKKSDALALKNAALAGEPDPGWDATKDSERALVYQEERLRAAARLVSAESATLKDLFKEHRLALMETACEAAESTVTAFSADVAEIQAKYSEAVKRREEGLAPLRWVASLTDGNLSFDPSFPMDGNFTVPRTGEAKVTAIVALIRKMYLDKAKEAA